MIELSCSDFPVALAALEKLGLRIDMIMPADDPQVAELSGNGIEIRLVLGKPTFPDELEPAFAVTRGIRWHVGRAGMMYRDLIPDRQGGRFVASHIRIPAGGAVADYVHHHQVRFQMIYCYKGWVRLVYEDQGEPFVMHAGECVLQPPRIRHRVLESSPGLEVIEIGSPAAHATVSDYAMTLPNGTRERAYGGQRFAVVKPGSMSIAEATGGLAGMQLRSGARELNHDAELYFGFVLRGSLRVTCEERTEELDEADAFVLPAGHHCAINGFGEWLEVTLPPR